ncbi:MAG: tRNA-dihydrouridine synthase [Alphaproteobacteria bacterium]|nr:tRNA-dihydrouridine synthase [Alphaproteobacteria bacterium]MCB9696502.1 tRNA-dihydrouridine synthase [Alphaproteobacteria bacterium]
MSTHRPIPWNTPPGEPPLVLAPMEGVTDLTFRRLVRGVGGCSMTVTEFVAGAALAGGHRIAMRAVAFDPDEHPIAIQVFGRDPDLLAEGARTAVELGADVVDLNMGCPSKKVCAHSGGSALMKEPELARRIVAAIRRVVTVPFTVKMRSGWDAEHRNAPEIARMCQEEGADGLTVHWRTRTDGYGGVRDLSTIGRVVERVTVPVLANGDVDETNAVTTLAETGATGLMIGRGAIQDPWVFHRVRRALRGQPPLVIDDADRERVLLDYYRVVRATFESDRGALGRMKKIARYFQDVPELRQRILHSETPEEAEERVRDFFAARRLSQADPGASPRPDRSPAPAPR